MDGPIDTRLFKRIAILIDFQQQFKTNPQKIYEKIYEIIKRIKN